MKTVHVSQLENEVGERVALEGWVYQFRSSGKIHFLVLRDGTGLCQCVITRETLGEPGFEQARRLTRESSVRVSGRVRRDDRAPGAHELDVDGLDVVHTAEEYPISPKRHGVDFLMRHRHLWLRSPRQAAILRVRHTLIGAVRRFFDDRGFVLIDTPIFAPSAGEGASTLFRVDYFGEPVYLAQTGQLYLEAAAMALGKVYCFGPTFRAEKSKTRRHLTEFWMVEPEVAFADLDAVMTLAEDLVCAVVEHVLSERRADLEFLGRDAAALETVRRPFPRISYDEAVGLLHSDATAAQLAAELKDVEAELALVRAALNEKEHERERGGKAWKLEKLAQEIVALRERIGELEDEVANRPLHMELARGFEWGKDLGGSDETIVSRSFERPVMVHRYPKAAKAFYMKVDPADPRVVLNVDMLAPEGYGEIVGGSQREDDLDALRGRMADEGLAEAPYDWYLDLRRYGSVPHGGFGLGIERTLAWICGLKHIREAIPFPRLTGRLYP